MPKIPENLCEKIILMEKSDNDITEQLRNKKELEKYGYHPVLEKLHLTNSKELNSIIERYGFPTLKNSSQTVVCAAWRIVQHSISDPVFMKKCYTLFKEYSLDEIPLKERAYLGDRIAFYERKPQRFGTQFDYDLSGKMTVWWLENKIYVEKWRTDAGLPTLKEVQQKYDVYPTVSVSEAKMMRKQQEEWLINVGWCTADDIAQYYLNCGR